MTPHLKLLMYGVYVLTVSLTHNPAWLAGCWMLTLIVAQSDAPRLLRRALTTTLLFSGFVTAAHIMLSLTQGHDPWLWALRTNLRVLALTSATLLFSRHVHPLVLAGSSPILQTVVILVLAQISTLRRLVSDARNALRSRTADRPGITLLVRHGGTTAATLLRKAHHDLTTTTEAMASRGFFLDADRD